VLASYDENAAGRGVVPLARNRRDPSSSDREVLLSRMVDRSLRPVLASGRVSCSVKAFKEGDLYDPAALAVSAASLACKVAGLPLERLVAATRVCSFEEGAPLRPMASFKEQRSASLNIVVAGPSSHEITMLEGEAAEVAPSDLIEAVKFGAECNEVLLAKQREFLENLGFDWEGVPCELAADDEGVEELHSRIHDTLQGRVEAFARSDIQSKKVRGVFMEKLVQDVRKELSLDTSNDIHEVIAEEFARVASELDMRPGGRKRRYLRRIFASVNVLPSPHGSALFTRGDSQVLGMVSLGPKSKALKHEPVLEGPFLDNFFVSYNFPPYCMNAVGPAWGALNRRNIGHAQIAQRAIRRLIPKDFDFVLHANAEVLQSEGSTSMATVCAIMLALMDAGVPIPRPVAGISFGAYLSKDKTKFTLLTDILGMEDFYGVMDFKICGSRRGLTSFQLDIKVPALEVKYIAEAIQAAPAVLESVIDKMTASARLEASRSIKKNNFPILEEMEIDVVRLRPSLLRNSDRLLEELEDATKTVLEFNERGDGKLSIFSSKRIPENVEKMNAVLRKIVDRN